MRSLLLLFVAVAMSSMAFSQTITVQNSSACDVRYYIAATDPGCSTGAYSITYVVPAGGSMSFNFGSITWSSGAPGAGWQWQFIKGGNFCGPYNYAFPNCTSTATANDNVIVMGIPCSGFGTTQCANMTTGCNNAGCSWIRCSWTNLGGGNVIVSIG